MRSGKIPSYIWCQIQIQLEVCDLPYCHLFECFYSYKNRKYTLNDYILETVHRDKKWFDQVALPELQSFWSLLQRARKYQFSGNPYPVINEWFSIKDFTGYLLDDPIVDWLRTYQYSPEIKNIKKIHDHKDAPAESTTTSSRKIEKYAFFDKIYRDILQFCSDHSFEYFYATPYEEGERESFSTRLFSEVQKKLESYIEVIIRPVLLNYGRKIYGIADVIMRNDIADLFLKEKMNNTKGKYDYLNLSTYASSKNGYTLFCLSLKNNHCKNKNQLPRQDSFFPDRKKHFTIPPSPLIRRSKRFSQVEITDHPTYQSHQATQTETLLREWENVLLARYCIFAEVIDSILPEKGPRTIVAFLRRNSCSIVSLSELDRYKRKIKEGTEWAKLVREKGKEWIDQCITKPDTLLPPDKRLMPNMCSKFCQNWFLVKRYFAEKWGELTLLWHCGLKQRQKAFEKNIYTWRDHRIPPQKIVNSFYSPNKNSDKQDDSLCYQSKRKRILHSMIKINRSSNEIYSFHKSFFPKTEKNKRTCLELFIDFEVASHLRGIIYLIGMGWKNKDKDNHQWQFASFVASSLDRDAEKDVLNRWWDKVNELRKSKSLYSKVIFYHWSQAEPRFLKKSLQVNQITRITNDLEKFSLFGVFGVTHSRKSPMLCTNTDSLKTPGLIYNAVKILSMWLLPVTKNQKKTKFRLKKLTNFHSSSNIIGWIVLSFLKF
jgi:hypothetical protein